MNKIDYTSVGHVEKQTSSHINVWFGDSEEYLWTFYKDQERDGSTYNKLVEGINKAGGKCSLGGPLCTTCNGIDGMYITIMGPSAQFDYSNLGPSIRIASANDS